MIKLAQSLQLSLLVSAAGLLPVQAGVITSASYEGRLYYLLDTDGTKWWDAAQAEAIALGGHLVTVNSAAENQFILDTFAAPAVQYAQSHSLPDRDRNSFWIGLSDHAVEFNYTWATGDLVAYTNWASGQPQNGAADEDYAGMFVNFGPAGQWHDIVGDTRNPDLPFAVVETASPRAAIATVINGDKAFHLLQTSGRDWWVKAQAQAVRYGGDLLAISSHAENEWVLATFGSTAVSYAATHNLPGRERISFWLGLSDHVIEGSYQWKSGAPLNYTNWETDQPQATTPDEDFIAMAVNFGQPGKWHDIVNDQRRGDLPFTIVVTDAPVLSLQMLPAQVMLTWKSPLGWQLEASPDLTAFSWQAIQANSGPGGFRQATRAPEHREFYRMTFTGPP